MSRGEKLPDKPTNVGRRGFLKLAASAASAVLSLPFVNEAAAKLKPGYIKQSPDSISKDRNRTSKHAEKFFIDETVLLPTLQYHEAYHVFLGAFWRYVEEKADKNEKYEGMFSLVILDTTKLVDGVIEIMEGTLGALNRKLKFYVTDLLTRLSKSVRDME